MTKETTGADFKSATEQDSKKLQLNRTARNCSSRLTDAR